MIPELASFRRVDASNEKAAEVARRVQIVDTFGFEIVQHESPVPAANLNDGRPARPEGRDVVPFATTLRRIA
jgi:hypothetical protein